jgi:hypothetical protein
MWGTLAELVAKLQSSFARGRSDLDVLRGVFGETGFVYLWT